MSILGKLFAPLLEPSRPLPENAVLIDVRSPAEFASGHIKDAITLPLDRLAHEIHHVVVDPSTPVIVYCQSGIRSASACRALLNMGYANAVNGGGIQALASRMNREIAHVVFSGTSSACHADPESNR